MATILHADGRREEVHPRNGHDFQLDELQAIVGGYIDLLMTRDGRRMVINDEGKILGLPRNEVATSLVGFAHPGEITAITAMYRAMGFSVFDLRPNTSEPDFIAGPALVCEVREVR